ncbi:MAG: hypothetical protein GX575_02970 [Candidatus Anammoximicrobium sp.]|nr:hypothetical protein [Candidatus Anammoximicrobium sp.]
MIRGRVQQGVVLLDDPEALPDGTEVSVRPLKSEADGSNAGQGKPTVGRALLRLAGKAQGLPPDASRNLDHYLYGHRKR